MSVQIYSDVDQFKSIFGSEIKLNFIIFDTDVISVGDINTLESLAQKSNSINLAEFEEIFEFTLAEIKEFFFTELKAAENWFFSHVSSVPLAIPSYIDIQKFFLLRAYIKTYPNKVIHVLCPSKRINSLVRAAFSQELFSPPRVVIPSISTWLRFSRTLLRTLINHTQKNNKNTIVFSLATNLPKTNIDTYFGDLQPFSRVFGPMLRVYWASGKHVKLPTGEDIVPLEAFAIFVDAISAMISSLYRGLGRPNPSLHQDFSLNILSCYIKATEIRSGEYFQHVFAQRAFRRMFSLSPTKYLVYPYENRSWEKLLLSEAKRAKVEKCIAYQHSSITPRHLAFEVDSDCGLENFLPDLIVTCGKVTHDLLKDKSPIISDRILSGISLRRMPQKIPSGESQSLLVAISSSRHEARSMLRITNKFARLVEVPIIIRSHPTIKIDDIFNSFDWSPNVKLSKNKTLVQDLSDASLVAYSSSTVALDGMLSGRLPIFINIGDLPSGDPISNANGFKFSVSSAEEFVNVYKHLSSLTDIERTFLEQNAVTYAESYLVEQSEGNQVELISAMKKLIFPRVN